MISKFKKFGTAANALSLVLALNVLTMNHCALPVCAAGGADAGAGAGAGAKSPSNVSDAAFADQMKQFATAIKGAIAGLSAKFQSEDTEKAIAALPSKETVIQNKDVEHFREYSGLSEVYLFNNKITEAEALRSWVRANSAKVLGADDPYPAVIDSDFGLFYYDKGDLTKADSLLKESLPRLESHMTSKPDEVRNNLISVYAGLAEIAFSRGKKADARHYLDKITKIAPAQ